jgi:hypothetical protein
MPETPPRVSHADLAAFLPSSTTVDFTPYLVMSHAFVEARLGGQGVDEHLLVHIEMNIAADMVLLDEQRIKSESRGRASITYETYGSASGHTRYWEWACRLDPTGGLQDAGKRRATFAVIAAP